MNNADFKILYVPPSSVQSSPFPLTSIEAKEQVSRFMGSAISLLKSLKDQNQPVHVTADKIEKVLVPLSFSKRELSHSEKNISITQLDRLYQHAGDEISALETKLHTNIESIHPQRQKDIHHLHKQLKNEQKEVQLQTAVIEKLSKQLENSKLKNEEDKKGLDYLYQQLQLPSPRKERKRLAIEEQISQSVMERKKLTERLNQVKLKVAQSEQVIIALEKQISSLKLHLSETDIVNLRTQLKIAEKEVIRILHRTQINAVAEIGEQSYEGIKAKVAHLAQDNLESKMIRLLANIPLVSKTYGQAIHFFDTAKESINEVKQESPAPSSKEEMERGKQTTEASHAPRESLNHRTHVMGINSLYQPQVMVSKKEIKKQLRLFVAQSISAKDNLLFEHLTGKGKEILRNSFPSYKTES